MYATDLVVLPKDDTQKALAERNQHLCSRPEVLCTDQPVKYKGRTYRGLGCPSRCWTRFSMIMLSTGSPVSCNKQRTVRILLPILDNKGEGKVLPRSRNSENSESIWLAELPVNRFRRC